MSNAPSLMAGAFACGGAMRLSITTKRRTVTIEWQRHDEQSHEPQPQGDVFTHTERSGQDEPGETRVGFRGA